MERISSTEFQKAYPRLTKVTEVTALGRVIGTWTPVGAEIGGTVVASHFERHDGEVERVIDEVKLHEVSIVEDTKANRDAGAGHITAVDGKPVAPPDLGHSFGASRPAPKPGKKK